jgi:transcriptional regulator with XRE-family HTH domain
VPDPQPVADQVTGDPDLSPLDYDPHRLGSRIQRLREQAGHSRQQLADLAGIGRVTLYQAELGQHSLSLVRLFAVAHALGVAPGTLLDEVNP